MVSSNDSRHNVVNLSSLEFSFVVAEHLFTGVIDLIHDAAIFAIELQKDDSVLFTALLTACEHLLLFVSLYLESASFFQNSESLFFIVEHADQVLGIKMIAFNVLELSNIEPRSIDSNFERKEVVCEVIQLFNIAFGV